MNWASSSLLSCKVLLSWIICTFCRRDDTRICGAAVANDDHIRFLCTNSARRDVESEYRRHAPHVCYRVSDIMIYPAERVSHMRGIRAKRPVRWLLIMGVVRFE